MPDGALRPGALGHLTLPHRIVMGSMHLGVEASEDAPRVLAAFYAARARGGAALIVTGGVAVNRVGAGGADYAVLGEPDDEATRRARIALRAAADAVHEAGGRIALQLFHAGRYASPEAFGLRPVAPSPVYSTFSRCEPAELTDAQTRATIGDFARAAAIAKELGFDGVEVMGSEGYLVNQFLSPVTNRRDDAWGGDAERRAAFPLALVAAIREATGTDFALIFRMSGADLVEGSTTHAETLAFARRLARAGVDAINVGVGWHEARVPTVQTLVPLGTWAGHAAAIKAALAPVAPELPVIASNRVNRIAEADQLLATTGVDFVSMARPFLADPDLVAKSRAVRVPAPAAHRPSPDEASDRLPLVNVCIGCDQACIDRSLVGERVSCLVNPRAGREHEPPTPPAGDRPGRFAVIGGGPAGLEAARELASVGHRVELFEAAAELGGQFRLARQVPGKRDYGATIDYFTRELRRLGVTVSLDTRLTPNQLSRFAGYDGIVLATGVTPRQIDLPGVELPHVLGYQQAFTRLARDTGALGSRVAIIGGGGIAVDLAHLLSEPGAAATSQAARRRFLRRYHIDDPCDTLHSGPDDDPEAPDGTSRAAEVTIMLRGKSAGRHIGRSTRWALIDELRHAGVTILRHVTYHAITSEGVLITDEQHDRRLVAADTVVIAAGQQPNDTLLPALRELAVPYEIIGGGGGPPRPAPRRAITQGLDAARALATHHATATSVTATMP
jgi:2,4-dienoyl-CoA reductase (NADPH2)